MESIRAGCILVDGSSGELRLATHIGLSASFIDKVSRCGAETPRARFVMRGGPTYWPNVRGVLNVGELPAREGLTSLAVIPVKSKGEVGGRAKPRLPRAARDIGEHHGGLEAITAQIGGIVSRVRTEEDHLELLPQRLTPDCLARFMAHQQAGHSRSRIHDLPP